MEHTNNNDFTMHVFHSLFSLSCYVMDFQEHAPWQIKRAEKNCHDWQNVIGNKKSVCFFINFN